MGTHSTRRPVSGSFLIATLMLGLAACSSSRHDTLEKYYLVSANIKNTYWQAAFSGLDRGARSLGVQAEMVGPDTYDVQAEAQAFRDAVAKKPAGILVSVADPAVMKDPIDAAIGQGIPVITIDSDAPASKRITFIGTNNYQAGLMGGRVLAERLHSKGNVVVYTMPGQPNLDERLQGYKTTLADHPQIKLQVVNVKGDPRIAFDTTANLVKGKSAPEAFVCLVSFACPEVAEVLDRNKVENKVVVAMDTDPNTINWIKKGMIAATIAQKPYTMSYFGVILLDTLHHMGPLSRLNIKGAEDTRSPVPMFIDTGATLIDKNNVDEFQKAQTPAPASGA